MKPKKAYDDQLRHAAARNIIWDFSYSEWLEMWLVSEKWSLRGKKTNQYCMGRFGDEGPYSKRNCSIILVSKNLRERWEGKEKITNKLALLIIETYLNTKLTQREVAAKFSVDQSYVSRIVNKKRKIKNERS